MEIRQRNQKITLRTVNTNVKRSSMTLKTGKTVDALTSSERREAERLITEQLTPTQRRYWNRMPARKKEAYLAEAVIVLREDSRLQEKGEKLCSSAPDLTGTKAIITEHTKSIGHRQNGVYERNAESLFPAGDTVLNTVSADTRQFNVPLLPRRDGQRKHVTPKGLERKSKAPVIANEAGSGTFKRNGKTPRKHTDRIMTKKNTARRQTLTTISSAALTGVISRVKEEIQTEEQAAFRKHTMITGSLGKGVQDAFPFLLPGKTGVAGKNVVLTILKRSGAAIGTIFKPFLILMGMLLLCVVILCAIIFPGSLHDNTVSMEGLPAMISEEMVSAAIEMRDEYNQPASVLLAQIIVESRGRYGNGLSLLAYQYHNLFGIKSFNSSDNRIFMWNRAHTDGGWYRIFESHTECIEYRAQMLTRPRYTQYTNEIDWRTKEGAQSYAQGIKNGGWAEDPNYVSSLVEQMNQYDLYRYDTMSMNEAMTAGTLGGGTGADVVAYACQFIGNRYVWGGESLTNGCDCSGFVMKVYEHFGVSMPHSSYAQRSVGRAVSVEDMQPGDIVCYSGHVGIYAGNGQIVNASNSKPYPKGGIKYTNVGYRTIVAVRRIF